MNFSKRSRYGIRALIDLAHNRECSCVQLSDIADRNGIPAKYLEQIFMNLRKAGILGSIKGAQGGYFLTKDPRNLNMADIITALEGSYILEAEASGDSEKGNAEALAVQTEIIDPVNCYLEQFLSALTLEKLAESSEKNKEGMRDMYYI